jgi:hypothetical protein
LKLPYTGDPKQLPLQTNVAILGIALENGFSQAFSSPRKQ